MLPCSRYSQKYLHPTTRSTMWLVEALFLLVPNIVQIYWCLNWGTLPSITDAPYGRPMLVGCCGTRWGWFIWFIVWAQAATPARHIQPDYWIVVSPPPNNGTRLQLSNWGNNSSSVVFIETKPGSSESKYYTVGVNKNWTLVFVNFSAQDASIFKNIYAHH